MSSSVSGPVNPLYTNPPASAFENGMPGAGQVSPIEAAWNAAVSQAKEKVTFLGTTIPGVTSNHANQSNLDYAFWYGSDHGSPTETMVVGDKTGPQESFTVDTHTHSITETILKAGEPVKTYQFTDAANGTVDAAGPTVKGVVTAPPNWTVLNGDGNLSPGRVSTVSVIKSAGGTHINLDISNNGGEAPAVNILSSSNPNEGKNNYNPEISIDSSPTTGIDTLYTPAGGAQGTQYFSS